MTTRSSLCSADCNSLDYTERRFAPMIVNNVVTYDNSTYVTNVPKYTDRIGMIFNNKQYKTTSSEQKDIKKQISYTDTNESTNVNDVVSHVPMMSFQTKGKRKLLTLLPNSLDGEKYGEKLFSQDRYLLKKKESNFKCEQRKYIC